MREGNVVNEPIRFCKLGQERYTYLDRERERERKRVDI